MRNSPDVTDDTEPKKGRFNISMDGPLHIEGKQLAKDRGTTFSELLSGLLRAELRRQRQKERRDGNE